jgi:hypothetical protein
MNVITLTLVGTVITRIVVKLAAAYANTVIVQICPGLSIVESAGVRFQTDSVPTMLLHQENF